MELPAKRRKAILVDGASTNHMKIALGIAVINFAGLYRLLVNEVGLIRELAFAPLITLHPDKLAAARPRGIAKDCSGAGFDVIPVESTGGADDKAIKNIIANLDSQDIGEIVVVSADKDFVPILRVKAGQGVTVWWVSIARSIGKNGHSGMSEEVHALCKEKVFNFFDLAPRAGLVSEKRLSPQDARHVSSSCSTRSDSFTRITLRLENTSPMEHRRLAAEVRRLQETFQGLTFSIDA